MSLQGPGRSLGSGFGHCTSPPPLRRPALSQFLVVRRAYIKNAGQVWSVMGRSHSAATCSPLGVGVVLGNCTCLSNSGFKWLDRGQLRLR